MLILTINKAMSNFMGVSQKVEMPRPGFRYLWTTLYIHRDTTLQMITALLLLISCTLDVLLAGLHLVAVHDQLLYCITARLQLHSIW